MTYLDAPPRLIDTEGFSSTVLVADISELR
jgi:hypothetical protein